MTAISAAKAALAQTVTQGRSKGDVAILYWWTKSNQPSGVAQTTDPDRNIQYSYNTLDQRTAVNNGMTITQNTLDNLGEVLSTQVTTAPPQAAGGALATR